MKNRVLAMIKPLALSIAAIALFTLGQSSARADEVTVGGYTNGCFNCAAPPNTPTTQTDTLLGLTYTNAQFSGTTAGGFLAFGGNPTPPGVQSSNNFGSFTLSSAANTYTGNTFALRVTFTVPTGINGSNSQVFTATLTGQVVNDTTGGVRLDFDESLNTTGMLFTFSNANGSGSFRLRINDLSINPGQTASLNADIFGAQQTAVPEPATMILLGTGLAGIAAKVRKRRKAAQQD
ncbi:MAG TPA: PEP-CTERM sorting domain-containing protein [Pyrinomonadaceae bacterium]|nr:PEP-CTERM sorting domain-containing protein [Pyrinomonadaceae bacterium]